jgi:hypothetical protein
MESDNRKRFDQSMQQFALVTESFEQRMLSFILTEVETGIAFASIALGSTTEEKRQRNRDSARKAYSSAAHFWKKHPFAGQTVRQELLVRAGMLEQMLVQLGESFER